MSNNQEVTKEIAQKVLETVDAGLVAGLGQQVPGQMCIEAAVCFAYGLPHSDKPPCVGSAVRAFKIKLNDANWSSKEARTTGLRALSIAQLGSAEIDQVLFSRRMAIETVRQIIGPLFRERGFAEIATRCENVVTLAEARAAADAAAAYAYADAAADAAAYAYAYADAAADAAAYAAAYATADATATATAAAAAAYAAYATADTKYLQISADIALEILMELGSPGCEFLDLLSEE